MGMTRLLVALYPGTWRAVFGEEFAALLEDTRLTPRVVFDVVVTAGRLHAGAHRRVALALAALLWTGCLEYLCVHAHLTANILWAPTTPARALTLAATAGPWLAFAWAIAARRLGRKPPGPAGEAAR
jgi:hypothetical protein